jgi:hypothetical protein
MGEDLAVQNEWREKFAAIPLRRKAVLGNMLHQNWQSRIP